MGSTEKIMLSIGVMLAVIGIWFGSGPSDPNSGADEEDIEDVEDMDTRQSEREKAQRRLQTDDFPDPDPVPTATGPSGSGFSLTDFYEKSKDAIFFVYASNGLQMAQGTGFFISGDGRAVSNFHVFEGAESAYIEMGSRQQQFPLKETIKEDPNNDLVVFDVDLGPNRVPFLDVDFSLPRIGEKCYAIGNPKNLNRVLSEGIISGFLEQDDKFILFSAEITNGSSGGPLFNSKGKVIGITTGAVVKEANLNLAVRIDKIQ